MSKRTKTDNILSAIKKDVAEHIESIEPIKETALYSAIVDCEKLNIRKRASMDSEILGVLSRGDKIIISEEKNNFGKLNDREGWICLDFIKR